MASIEFVDATIAHGRTTILRDVSLSIPDGEFVGVIGPSGSGKTSLIRSIAGFVDVVAGSLLFDGVDARRVRTGDRDVGMVFQEPVLFNNRTVERNVSFPLEIQRQQAEEIRQRVGAEVRALHLEHLLERHPSELSRGESQLVQIARAMVRTPRVLLLDEPLASLDEVLQRRMRAELKMLQEGYGVTTVMTTNDPLDALTMPTRLAVLSDGRLVQVGTPAEVRRSPITVDAAIATGECWTVPASVTAADDGYWLSVDDAAGNASALRHRAWAPALADYVGRSVLVGIRPSDVSVSEVGTSSVIVRRVIPGSSHMLHCDVGGHTMGVPSTGAECIGDRLPVRLDHVTVFDPVSRTAIC